MTVTVRPYDSSWPHEFLKIKSELEAALADVLFISIEHVGSTAIPYLTAKPILDIDVVATREQLQPVLEALQHPDLGLIYMGELGIADRHAFRAPQKLPVRNLYVCIEGSAALRNHLAVRDLLRGDEALRREYGELKAGLAASAMEIHEYMTAKGAFMLRMLRLSGQLTDTEIEDIRRATRSATHMAPIKLHNLVMREFVIGDVDAVFEAKLAPTLIEAIELVVDIIQNAGKAKRTHAELALLIREDRGRGEELHMVGRVGIRILKSDDPIDFDGTLRREIGKKKTGCERPSYIHILYVFIDRRRGSAMIGRTALPAFMEAVPQTVQNDGSEDAIAPDTDSETVWNLLRGKQLPLTRIDSNELRHGMIYWIDGPPYLP